MSLIQYAVFNDVHYPYESKAYYEALSLAQKFPNLRGLILNGDILEIESVSRHPKTPGAQRALVHEIIYANKKFDQIQKIFGDLPVEFIEGNHCHRILRYIRDVAPEMWGMIHTPKLFEFEKRPNWHFLPYGPAQWFKVPHTRDLYARHEPLVGGQMCAKGTAEKSYVSVLFGHTHTHQSYVHKKAGPKPYHTLAMACGWLGDISKACFDYRGPKDNWMTGFTRVDVDTKSGEFEARFLKL